MGFDYDTPTSNNLSSTVPPFPLHNTTPITLLALIVDHPQQINYKMVKFSKELEAQLIPEWKEAFVNYWQLKKQIKRIKLSRLPKQSHHHAKPDFGLSIFDSLSFFVKNIAQNFSTSDHHDLNIIQVIKEGQIFIIII